MLPTLATIILVTVAVFILAALPLHLAVRLNRGHSTILKAILINILAAIVLSLANHVFHFWGPLIGFILLLFIYRYAFHLSLLKAFIVWVVQVLLVILFWFLAALLGIAAVGIAAFT